MKLSLVRFAMSLLLSAAASFQARALTVGFAQTGAESAWRVANTQSIKAEAEKRGVTLRFVDGLGKQENQIAAVRGFIAQKVDAILLAPIVVTGWEEILREAKAAGIPVILMDRKVVVPDDTLFTAFLGSDFHKEGEMAGEWLAASAGERRKIVELQGEPGSSAANERQRAFARAMAKRATAGFKIIDRQVANFRRVEGKQVMADLLKKHGREIEIVYAHNDDMALGAVQAIEDAGLKPGVDVLIVSIDAIKEAVQAVADGKINCTVECNPLFGPKAFDTIERVLNGEAVAKEMYNKDDLFDHSNAAAALPTRKY